MGIEMQPVFYRFLRAGPHGWSSAAAEAEAEAEEEQEQAVFARISAACVRYAPPVASPFLSSPLVHSLPSLAAPARAPSTPLLSALLQAFSSPCLSFAVPALFLFQVGTVHYHSHFDL